ncbi:helix-turn-helix domain-containing protein [Candidatus Uabimicrobium amorphum]|uniref:AraC family transcriptional regulator n=1 Tax=Uabimicrobium amorphum TaxID=2596890 RepID=A0A5S9F270_UABAM|nr:AraC family transcriptional regulator [Candidatus Uabimicrobium amorphum]BBM82149.1 AraC family transcriptional regulator [Candidatus Uabimicrobium amorphum]
MHTQNSGKTIYEDWLIYTTQNVAAHKKYYQLYYFESGAGRVQIDEEFYSLVSPCLLCLSEQQKITLVENSDVVFHAIYFHPRILNTAFHYEVLRQDLSQLRETQQLDIYWLLPFIQSKGFLMVGPSTSMRILEVLVAIQKELSEKQGQFWICRSRSYFYELLNLVTHVHTSPHKLELQKSSEDDEVQQIVDYLNENYHQKVTITQLTEMFAMNRTTMAEKFHKATGMSVISYLSKIRIQMACILLRDTTLRVYEIMQRVGHEDATHFGRTFRKQMGKSPSKYRAEHQKK